MSLFTIAGFLAIVLTAPPAGISMQQRLQWAGIALIAQAVVAIMVLSTNFGLRDRSGHGARIARVMVVVLAGVVRGFLVTLLASAGGLDDSASAVARVVNSTYTTLIWMVVLSLVIDARVKYTREYRALFERDIVIAAASQADLDIPNSADLDSATEDVNALVRTWSAPVRARIDTLRQTPEAGSTVDAANQYAEQTVQETAEAIRELITTQLRPLSHRLWFDSDGRPPRSRLGPVMAEAWRRSPIFSHWVLVIILAGMLGGSLVRYGATVALVSGSVLVAWSGLYILATRHWVHRRGVRSVTWNLMTVPPFVLIAAVAPLLVSEFILGVGADVPTLILILIGMPGFGTALATAAVTSADRRQVLNVMRDPDALAQALRRVREREVATYLHNHVKSQLTASAMKLRDAAADGDREGVRSAAQAAHEILSRPVPDAITLGQQSPWERLHEVAEAWSGIADIEVDLPEELPGSVVILLADMLSEMIANSVRAAGAQQVTLTGRFGQDVIHGISAPTIEIEVVDDGEAVPQAPSDGPGLGTAWLDAMVPGRWSREVLDRGSVVRASIPIPTRDRGPSTPIIGSKRTSALLKHHD